MKILIVANRNNAKTIDAMFQIVAYLDSQGIEHAEMDVTGLPDSAFVHSGKAAAEVDAQLFDVDLIVALGGDGTILHTARIAHVLRAPMLGANFGHLGFLTNSAEGGIIPLLADALAGEIISEARTSLHIQVVCEGDEDEDAASPREFFAFNEIAIARGALGHIVDLSFSISGDHVASMRGDGLVVATATGSTAYALSAGGPLVGPLHRGLIVAPLVPHTLNSRAIVTERHDVVEVTLEEGSASAAEVSLFVDGDALSFERPVNCVIVSADPEPVTLLTRREESFYKQIARTFF